MMIPMVALLAQLVTGGGPLAATPGPLPPTCSPSMPNGTVCTWRGYAIQVPSKQHPEKSILVSVQSTEPPDTPEAGGHLVIRHGIIRIVLEYAATCDVADTFEYNLEFGTSCPFPGPPD